jgi:hypothetical protein
VLPPTAVPALIAVLAVWVVAQAITLWVYVASSLAPMPVLLGASQRASAHAMWLVPGVLLLAQRSGFGIAAGSVAIVCGVGALAATRMPFRYGTRAPGRTAAFAGALCFQAAPAALALDHPAIAAACLAIAAAIWTAASVSRGAVEPRRPMRGATVLLTLLLTATLSAALLYRGAAPRISFAETQKKTIAIPLADPTRTIGKREKIPGVVLRPGPRGTRPPRLVAPPGLAPVAFGHPAQTLFTGEYHLFRTDSAFLPEGSIVESGTPIENRFRTLNGMPMLTAAVQSYAPPLDLRGCTIIGVALTTAEDDAVLVTLQLRTREGLEDAGTDLTGIGQSRHEALAFRVPAASRPRIVDAIRILFQNAGPNSDKNARVAVDAIAFLPCGP